LAEVRAEMKAEIKADAELAEAIKDLPEGTDIGKLSGSAVEKLAVVKQMLAIMPKPDRKKQDPIPGEPENAPVYPTLAERSKAFFDGWKDARADGKPGIVVNY
jgi:hypothetical protein